MELYAAQLVTAGGEGVEEAGGLGADGDGDLITGGDGGDGFVGGDEVLPVVLSPVHRWGEGGGVRAMLTQGRRFRRVSGYSVLPRRTRPRRDVPSSIVGVGF